MHMRALRTLDHVTAEDNDSDPRPALAEPIRTERLTLRAATRDDAAATFTYRSQEAIARWLTQLPTDANSYREAFTEASRLSTTVIIELDGKPIGDLMLRVEDAWAQAEVREQATGAQAELGWVLDPDYAGHGYATEAARGLLEHCFVDLGVRRVVAICFLDNDASWRLMERLGMRREAHAIKDALHRDGRWFDSLTYALLAEEYNAGTGEPSEPTRG